MGRGDVDNLDIHVATLFKLIGTIEWKGEDPGGQRVSDPGRIIGTVTLMNPDATSLQPRGS